MADTTSPNFGAVIATGITAQALGGAMAIVFIYFFHASHPNESPPPEAVEQAIGYIFSTVVSTAAMVVHLVLRKYLST